MITFSALAAGSSPSPKYASAGNRTATGITGVVAAANKGTGGTKDVTDGATATNATKDTAVVAAEFPNAMT